MRDLGDTSVPIEILFFFTRMCHLFFETQHSKVFENTGLKKKNLFIISFLLHSCIYAIYYTVTKHLAAAYFETLCIPGCYCICAGNKLL